MLFTRWRHLIYLARSANTGHVIAGASRGAATLWIKSELKFRAHCNVGAHRLPKYAVLDYTDADCTRDSNADVFTMYMDDE